MDVAKKLVEEQGRAASVETAKKTVDIPVALAERAEKAGLDVSAVLVEALEMRLQTVG
jgi:post-segregation antitoxin (ccd killing protein)